MERDAYDVVFFAFVFLGVVSGDEMFFFQAFFCYQFGFHAIAADGCDFPVLTEALIRSAVAVYMDGHLSAGDFRFVAVYEVVEAFELVFVALPVEHVVLRFETENGYGFVFRFRIRLGVRGSAGKKEYQSGKNQFSHWICIII